MDDRDTALYGAIIVNLMRLYDVGMMLLLEQNPAAAEQLREMHKQGKLFAPPPAIWIGEENRSDNE